LTSGYEKLKWDRRHLHGMQDMQELIKTPGFSCSVAEASTLLGCYTYSPQHPRRVRVSRIYHVRNTEIRAELQNS